ncbi:MAG: hypothetical protein AAB513_01730 [Patescibacteria group bacterium]
MTPILKTAIFNAFATVAYIALVASFLFFVPKRLQIEEPFILIPIFMLSLFVFSASVTAGLVLGKPILWYMEGKKREAVSLFIYTLVTFFFIILAIGGLLLFFN